jgi:hypothetical protein
MKPVSRININDGILGLLPVCESVHTMKVCVDPRLELLAVVQCLSDYCDKFPLLSKHDFAYSQAVDKYFLQYREHDLVHFLSDLIARPFSYENPPFAFGAPPEVVLYLDSKGELHDDIYSNHFLAKRAGGEESLKQFIDLLKSFFYGSDFTRFYSKHHQLYQELAQRTSAKIGERDYILELEEFYGTVNASYTVILVSLFHSVGFGPRITVDGMHHIYNVMGPHRIGQGIPDFGSETYFTEMQRHEFSHGFVNPLTEKYWALAEPYFTAYDSPLEAQEVVNESIVRSVATLLAYEEDEVLGKRVLQEQMKRGFSLVEPLLHRLHEYVRSRDVYPTFDIFYPELLEVFKEHTHTRYTDKGTAQALEEGI